MDTIKEDIKSNFRTAFENNAGVVGQVLRDRREKIEDDKQIAKQVSKIHHKTQRITRDGDVIKKMEVAFTQISENIQLVNKWADAQVTTHDETIQALQQQKQEQAQAQKEKQQLNVQVPKPEEDQSIFNNILSLFGSLAGKIKGKFPKGLKGKQSPKGGKPPKGKAGLLKSLGSFAVRNAGAIATGGVILGTIAVAKAGGLQSKDQNEQQNVDYTVTPQSPENVKEQPPTPVPTPAAPPPPPAPVQAPAYACTCPPPQITPPAAPPPAPPPPAPTPPVPPPAQVTTTPEPTRKGKSAYQGEKPQPVAVPTPPPAPAVSPAPTPINTPLVAGKTSESPAAAPSSLSSVVSLAPDVTLDGIVSSFEKRVATMAAAFKQQTGKTLLVTSGIRTNEKQKELFDAKVAQLKGNVAAAKKLVAEPIAPLGNGRGSLHLKGLAVDINSKNSGGLNALAGTQDAPTGWLEKFGLIRPIKNEDWHVQMSGTPPSGDVGGVPGKDGNPIDPSTGKPLPLPKDPSTGQSLLDSSKTVAQLKQDNSRPGTTTIVVRDTNNITNYERKKQPQVQATAAVGA